MKKLVTRDIIKNLMAKRTPCYVDVIEWFNEYYIATDDYFLAKGKELKGYMGGYHLFPVYRRKISNRRLYPDIR